MGGGRWSKVCDIVVVVVVVVKVMQEFGIFPADRCKLCICVCVCVLVGYFSWQEVCDLLTVLSTLLHTLPNQHY